MAPGPADDREEREELEDLEELDSLGADAIPNRDNVIELLLLADASDDLDTANYYLRRAIAETLLLLLEQRSDA